MNHDLDRQSKPSTDDIQAIINEFLGFSDFDFPEKLSYIVYKLKGYRTSENLNDIFTTKTLRNIEEKINRITKISSEEYHSTLSLYIYELLNLLGIPAFLIKIENKEKWGELFCDLISIGNYQLRDLFAHRVRDYSEKTLFKTIRGSSIKEISWGEADKNIKVIASATLKYLSKSKHEEVELGILSENSIDMAYWDLASLTSGIVNVMIPANSVAQHIAYILNQTKVPLLILSDEKQLAKIKMIKNELPYLEKVVMLFGKSVESWVSSQDDFLKKYSGDSSERPKRGIDDLATVMYTSGTTGVPKGIMFSQKNLISKRYCRALALPNIGDGDRFLSYLPLFHTFGRYLEMLGAIFWGAEYTFMENPSVDTMIANMNLVKPTIFISIPKKWIQLYAKIKGKIDIETAGEEGIKSAVASVTGGKLKWGLSAAGYLPPEIFRFFQQNGIELMSGFGMTEATGGITMTPPGEYRENSLGRALPGIKLKLAEDGELLIKGCYVHQGYYGEKYDDVFDENGWFPTGDIMTMDKDGFIEIIDRKKEIYKNIKGETIAPQKIENYFREFDEFKGVFLVGDHRPYNTLLIVPKVEECNENIREYYSSFVTSVNRFLAPFERIVDFRIIDRNFSAEYDEISPKGTYKRATIEKNFKSVIDQMYEKDYFEIQLGNHIARIPNWFLRECGCISSDLKYADGKLIIGKLGKEIDFASDSFDPDIIRIGNYKYRLAKRVFDFKELLYDASLWLGNEQLFMWAKDILIQSDKYSRRAKTIEFIGVCESVSDLTGYNSKLKSILNAKELSLEGAHNAVLIISAEKDFELCKNALKYLTLFTKEHNNSIVHHLQRILRNPLLSENPETSEELFKLALRITPDNEFYDLLKGYLSKKNVIFDENTFLHISRNVGKEFFLSAVDKILTEEKEKYFEILFAMMRLYGINHPSVYPKLRQIFVTYQIEEGGERSGIAERERTALRKNFRKWLGKNKDIAVDPETGEEYSWKDVLVFDEEIPEGHQKKISKAISSTPILREAIFLFSKGFLVSLNNILPRGIRISPVRSFSDKFVYRVAVQTRFHGSYDLTFTINEGRKEEEIISEVNWLILAGSRFFMHEMLEDFGGYWDKYGIWSGKYNPGISAWKYLSKLAKANNEESRKRGEAIWPFFIWNATAAYINFWRLTNYKYSLTNASPENFIIPEHDYQIGAKIISISGYREVNSIKEITELIHKDFVEKSYERFPFLRDGESWNFIFSGIINALGEESGVATLRVLLKELEISKENEFAKRVSSFIIHIEEGRYTPKQLFFAIRRFHNWLAANEDADIFARAKTLNELYDTYHLDEVQETYPETRIKFYWDTLFRNSKRELKKYLEMQMRLIHNREISTTEAFENLEGLHSSIKLNKEESFFITRMCYPHIQPKDVAEMINVKDKNRSFAQLIVRVEDNDGNTLYLRKPNNPKEILKLQKLFIEEKLNIIFREEHDFLLAISERGFVIGGIAYIRSDEKNIYLDKIVIDYKNRKKGISEKLMNEFLARAKNNNARYVTTGFMRPEYFYKFGFSVEKKFSGLVKIL